MFFRVSPHYVEILRKQIFISAEKKSKSESDASKQLQFFTGTRKLTYLYSISLHLHKKIHSSKKKFESN